MILSKLHEPAKALRARLASPLMAPGLQTLRAPASTNSSGLGQLFGFPKQYQQPMVPNFRSLVHVLSHHWELIPLFGVVAVAGLCVCVATYRGFHDKVDVQLTGHSWNCISRNMDLCHSTVHKLLTINQKYEPWPEMQRVLDKMAEEEALLQEAVPKWLAPRFLAPKVQRPALRAPSRNASMVPANQYENNQIPKKFQLGYALINHWEIIPLFLVVCFDLFVVLGIGLRNAFLHKLDTQFSGHNWNCISRNMNLRNPTIHKNLVFFQRYEPWPEMQDVLDKMHTAEQRLITRIDTCGKS